MLLFFCIAWYGASHFIACAYFTNTFYGHSGDTSCEDCYYLLYLRFVGYHRKTAFLVAVGLSQMSEFGFIIAKEGFAIRAISEQQYALLVALVFTTIMVSAPLSHKGMDCTIFFRRKPDDGFQNIS